MLLILRGFWKNFLTEFLSKNFGKLPLGCVQYHALEKEREKKFGHLLLIPCRYHFILSIQRSASFLPYSFFCYAFVEPFSLLHGVFCRPKNSVAFILPYLIQEKPCKKSSILNGSDANTKPSERSIYTVRNDSGLNEYTRHGTESDNVSVKNEVVE